LIGPEITGENISDLIWESEHEQKRKPGRPREIDPESLSRAVNDLQFVLEQNWGEVGWLLREAKSISDVRDAFAKIVHQSCSYLEPFTDDQTRETNPNELRALRKSVAELQERHSRNYVQRQSAQDVFDRASKARATDSDPLKQAQIQAILSDLEYKSHELDSLEKASRTELESLRTQLKEREASFAQAEILRFLESNRRQFTPLNVACAMAGLPHVTARVSCERCRKYGINPSHGIAFEMFQTIERTVPEPIRDLGRSIDIMREHLLSRPHNSLASAAQLRKNWYFLESAIRGAARDTRVQYGSLTFRIFAEYCRTSTSHSAAEEILAQANWLLRDGEEPEPERSPSWGPPRKSSTNRR
jgi:DnaJ-domain-containing protein 1